MKRVLRTLIMLSMVTVIAFDATAKREKKNEPRTREVEDTLEALGGEHFPEDMKIRSITDIEDGDTYFHIYSGELDSEEYHIIIFDNYGNYLGFYKVPYRPSNFEKQGHITLETGDINEYGDPLRYFIPIQGGPPKRVMVGVKEVDFVKSPNAGETGTSQGTSSDEPGEEGTSEERIKPDFREWTISIKGRTYKVPAIYVSQTFATVTLRGEGTGKEKEFPISSLSAEDREYIEQFK